MSVMEQLMEKSRISRRGFLQAAGALSATAALYGCGGGDGGENSKIDNATVIPKDNLVMDKEVKTVMTLHPMHCGGSCMLKLHVKNGRVLKVSSHGDIPREGSQAADESIAPIQRRACLKGLSERKRIYAPDRLKYPLKQTLERGNIRGFKRISWDEALDTVAGWFKEMINRKNQLGYLPIYDGWFGPGSITPYLGAPYMTGWGNTSYGNLIDAMHGAIGASIAGNPPADMFNSKFIIVWSNDHRVTRPHLAFMMVKAKEAGIPIVVIDTRHTDTVSTMGTGFGDVPPAIHVRPGTDSALQAAMAYVIYKKNLHDDTFIKDYCFGFYPGDSVVSQSTIKDPVTGAAYAGQTFTVPAGQSFVEYLNELDTTNGGYNGVLQWASRLTGVSANIIESLAIKYATTKPAFIYSSYNGGAQRTNNGMYYSWMLIALSAMTGNSNKRGGGFGEIRHDDGYSVQLGAVPPLTTVPAASAILFSVYRTANVIMNGIDSRTPEQLRDDVLKQNKVDLGPNPKLTVEMLVRGAGCNNPFNQHQAINKNFMAWNKLKYVVSYERVMTPTVAMSDIIFPVVTNFEESYFTKQYVADQYVVNGPIAPMYECKPDYMINELLAQRLNIDYGRKGKTDKEIMQTQWSTAKIPDAYVQNIDPSAKLPTFDEMLEKGNLQLPVPKEKSVIQAASYAPGKFPTDTGKINFYSPYHAGRKRAMLGVYRAQYVRPVEGYEDILENGGKIGAKGIKYTLQFITPHILQRAHTTFDNVAVLKDKFPQVVWIHPIDAANRGINNGDMVYVFNDYGCMKIPASVTKRVHPGMLAIGEGSWYRPSTTETYEAWLDMNNDGVAEKYTVPVDVGGAVNTITRDLDSGCIDPFIYYGYGLGMNAGGGLCEISKTHPDKK